MDNIKNSLFNQLEHVKDAFRAFSEFKPKDNIVLGPNKQFQKTFYLGVGLVEWWQGANTLENTVKVMDHYNEETEKAKETFSNVFSQVSNGKEEAPIEEKQKNALISLAKSAIWFFASARKNLQYYAATMVDRKSNELDDRVKKIQKTSEKQETILEQLFYKALENFKSVQKKIDGPETGKGKKAEAKQVSYSNEEKATARNNGSQAFQELIHTTNGFAKNLHGYEKEFSQLNEIDQFFFQTGPWKKMKDSADLFSKEITKVDNSLGTGQPYTDQQFVQMVDDLHDVFFSSKPGETNKTFEYLSQMILATIDIDKEYTNTFSNLCKTYDLNEDQMKKQMNQSRMQLWQTLAFQRITSRLTMPLKELRKNLAICADDKVKSDTLAKLNEIIELLDFSAELCQKMK